MSKENCKDRDGKSHFGEYGWYDGYHGTISTCRCGLNSRGGACPDVDLCIEEAHTKMEGKRTNIVSYNLANMHAGENKKEAEGKEDSLMAEQSRAKQKEEAEKTKLRDEAKKEGKIICGGCNEKINPTEAKEVKQGIIDCPKCGKRINGQTGDIIVGEEVKEEKKEEKKETEPKETKKETKEEKKEPNLEEEKATELVERKEYDHKCPHCEKLIGEKEIVDKGDGKTRHRGCEGVIKFTETPKVEIKEEKKEEKKEEVKEEPKKEEVKPEIKDEKKEDKGTETVADKPEDTSGTKQEEAK